MKVLCYDIYGMLQVVLNYIILLRHITEVHTPKENKPKEKKTFPGRKTFPGELIFLISYYTTY